MRTIFLFFSSVSILLCQQPRDQGLHFDFTSDVRLFTAHVLMNATGYDHEWRSAGMHPIRIAVRKDLEGRLDNAYTLKIRDLSSNYHWTGFGLFAFITAGPPDFRIAYDRKTSEIGGDFEQRYSGLSKLLAEFYSKVNIAQLWKTYQPLIQAENDKFKPFAPRALNDIELYCRLPKGFFSQTSERIHFQLSPLMSYLTGQTAKVNGEIYIVAGPQEHEPDETSFYHEVLHHMISLLTDSIDSLTISRFTELFTIAKSAGHLGYNQFDEAFVRTLDWVIGGKRLGLSDSAVTAGITNEYQLGFVLCLPVYEQLKGYEASSMTFAQYFPIIIANIDVNREKQRWLELTKGPR